MMIQWKGSPKEEVIVAGLMSGTSLDGIDVALVRIGGTTPPLQVSTLFAYSEPYESELRERLIELSLPSSAHSNVMEICSLNFYMAERFAEAVHRAVREAGLTMQDIDLISSHGQTVWHQPADDPHDPFLVRSTLQLGDLSVIAKRTGKLTVGDFRPADIAVGGQGAPLVPFGELLLFQHPSRSRWLQNIGGIGNCTILPPTTETHELVAFDTGPGNMIIDQVVQALSNGKQAFDHNGSWAAQGTPHRGLLDSMLRHPYFQLLPPKSTGRELFGSAYVADFLHEANLLGLPSADIVATATALTAQSIADSYRHFIEPHYRIDDIIVSGGGANNPTLLAMIQERLPMLQVATSAMLGIHPDAKEAVIFALLGHQFINGQVNHVASATGASRQTILGKLALP